MGHKRREVGDSHAVGIERGGQSRTPVVLDRAEIDGGVLHAQVAGHIGTERVAHVRAVRTVDAGRASRKAVIAGGGIHEERRVGEAGVVGHGRDRAAGEAAIEMSAADRGIGQDAVVE